MCVCVCVSLLPPASEGWGKVMFSVCSHLGGGGGGITQNSMGQTPGGGYPYPIMLCKITQNSMGQTPRGVPCQVQPGGGCTLPGVPYLGIPPGQVRIGGTQLGQQKEYSLHGGRYMPLAFTQEDFLSQLGYPPTRSGWGGTLPGYPPPPPGPGQDGGGVVPS